MSSIYGVTSIHPPPLVEKQIREINSAFIRFVHDLIHLLVFFWGEAGDLHVSRPEAK